MRPGDDRIMERCSAPHCRLMALRADMVPARKVTNGRRTRGYYCPTCAAYWGPRAAPASAELEADPWP